MYRFLPLAKRLLGQTWFVEKLAHAIALARSRRPGLELRHARRRTARTRRNADRRAAQRLHRPDLAAQPVAGPPDATWRIGDGHRRGPSSRSPSWASRSPPSSSRSTGARPNTSRRVDALAENRVAITAAEERRSQLDQQRAALEARTARRRAAARRRLAAPGRGPARSENSSTPAWARWSRSWRSSASKSTGWRAAAWRPTARPPRSRSSWPRARSGCATSRPA